MSALTNQLPQGADDQFPLALRPVAGQRDMAAYCERHRPELLELLTQRGALLFRGFAVFDTPSFSRAIDAICPERLQYVYRSSPRTDLGAGVFTATEYPPSETIGLHNENAYQRGWPRMIAFCCLRPALAGGETPVADVRKVTQRIGAELLDRFERRGVMYVRHYHPYVDLPWQTVFQVADREQLAAVCARHDIRHEWLSDDTLRTEQVCHGVALHPITAQRLWFNQAHMFHVSALSRTAAHDLAQCFGPTRIPRQAFYGDAEAISEQDMQAVRSAFEAESVSFRWESGDVLLLDNMLCAHGRRPFRGERRVITALLEETTATFAGARLSASVAGHGQRP